MKNPIIEAQIKVFRESFIKHGDTPKGIFANDSKTQKIRYKNLLKNLLVYKEKDFSIHDIGCSMCDLHQYLLENNVNHEFSGTEIVEEMVVSARKKYPNIKLYNRDFINDKIDEKYDFVVLSGILNLPGDIDHALWHKFIFDLIPAMFEKCNIGIAFNFLTTYRTFSDPTLFYLDPKEVLDVCNKTISRFIIMDQSYPLFETTTTIFKKEFLQGVYNDPSLEKYFKN